MAPTRVGSLAQVLSLIEDRGEEEVEVRIRGTIDGLCQVKPIRRRLHHMMRKRCWCVGGLSKLERFVPIVTDVYEATAVLKQLLRLSDSASHGGSDVRLSNPAGKARAHPRRLSDCVSRSSDSAYRGGSDSASRPSDARLSDDSASRPSKGYRRRLSYPATHASAHHHRFSAPLSVMAEELLAIGQRLQSRGVVVVDLGGELENLARDLLQRKEGESVTAFIGRIKTARRYCNEVYNQAISLEEV